VDGGDWVALGAVATSAIVSLVAIFQGPVISATQQRQAEHESTFGTEERMPTLLIWSPCSVI
jgi:hypothetical protein